MHLQQENYLGTTKSKSGRDSDLRIFLILSSALNKSASCSTTERNLSLTSCIRLTNLQKVKAVTRNSYSKCCRDLYAEVRDMHYQIHCQTKRQKKWWVDDDPIPFFVSTFWYSSEKGELDWQQATDLSSLHLPLLLFGDGFLVFCFTGKEESNESNRLEIKLWRHFFWYSAPIIVKAALRKICPFYLLCREPHFLIILMNQIVYVFTTPYDNFLSYRAL